MLECIEKKVDDGNGMLDCIEKRLMMGMSC